MYEQCTVSPHPPHSTQMKLTEIELMAVVVQFFFLGSLSRCPLCRV
jgi:hypothetical protein